MLADLEAETQNTKDAWTQTPSSSCEICSKLEPSNSIQSMQLKKQMDVKDVPPTTPGKVWANYQ